ncbi:ABC transporter permease [Brevibacillus fluminis]|uniref:ABC transporter permease n=1 Tax=Brevibacillus fluminis TaxID=511487 RepID=A0A3M8DHY6_9BACL|nr:ABC transporter permease [Brevibacillus fluminis]RNB87712.1 ABC transporter permease [Brevibacillus fluminis]
MSRLKRWMFHLFAFLVYSYLYFPILVTILFSFNPSRMATLPMKSFTLDWYMKLFADPKLWVAAKNSFLVSIPATLIAILFGTMAALLFQRHKFRGSQFLQLSILLPYILPGIITGISLTLIFKFFHVESSLLTVVIGHVSFITPVVMFLVMDRLRRFDKGLEFASMDLGATPLQTFFRITLPNIRGALAGGALLGLTLSLDEVVITFFLIGTDNTLPIQIWSMIRFGYSPQINAIYSIIVLLSLMLIFFLGKRAFFSKEASR